MPMSEEERARDERMINQALSGAHQLAQQVKDDHDITKAVVIEIRQTGVALRLAIHEMTRSWNQAMMAIEQAANTWEDKAVSSDGSRQ
jgi:hypothetical protein